MGFVKFTEPGKNHTAKVSVNSRGVISFNDAARRRFKMDTNPFCVLHFDPQLQIVGILFVESGECEGAKKLRLRSTGADIFADSFFVFFGIKITETRRYAIRDNADGMAVFSLSGGIVWGKSEEDTDAS